MKLFLRYFLPPILALSLYIFADAKVYYQLGPTIGDYFQRIFNPGSNMSDRTIKTRGYYEQLIHTERFNSPLSLTYTKKPKDWWSREPKLLTSTRDIRVLELRPSMEVSAKNVVLKTNSWGMRDKERELTAKAGTFRIAVLGSSAEMGSGVADDQTFSIILENLLNENKINSAQNYEVLNFAVSTYSALAQPITLEKKVLRFKPDLVLYSARPNDAAWLLNKIVRTIFHGIKFPYPEIENIIVQKKIESSKDEEKISKQLYPYQDIFLLNMYQRMVQLSKAHNARPVWVFTPSIGPFFHSKEFSSLSKIAINAGFIVIDLSRVYEGMDPEKLMLSEWDEHPNAIAHRLIAEALYKALVSKKLLIEDGANVD